MVRSVHELAGYAKIHIRSSSPSLSYERSIVSSKASFPESRDLVLPLSISIPSLFLKAILSSSSCLHHLPFCLTFSNMFQRAVPVQSVTNSFSPFLYCMQDVPLLLDSLYIHFSPNLSNSSASFSGTTFQNFQGFSDLHFEIS